MPDGIEQAKALLEAGRPAEADRRLSAVETEAFERRDGVELGLIWPILAEARTRRRAAARTGRIDLHTHTTASDGEMTVEQLLCEHFRQGQILINDHNIIDSLAEARRLVRERDLLLDVFCGIEVICTKERRAFEFMAIAPTLSDDFVALCLEHRCAWDRACDRFVEDLSTRDDLFEDPLWRRVAEDHEVGGPFSEVERRYAQVRARISADRTAYDDCLANNKTFDMGNLWNRWELADPGDPPQLNHRFFGSMRCFAMSAYCDELGDWFDYESLARRFQQRGCLISHNHPNYWDEDFIGELPHTLQTQWVRNWADTGVIDALEVWSPPFASKRVPHYWEKVCLECGLISMAGTDCHNGREQQMGGVVDNHPEIPPLLYAKLAESSIAEARKQTDPWAGLAAWRDVLAIDYAHQESLREVLSLVPAAEPTA